MAKFSLLERGATVSWVTSSIAHELIPRLVKGLDWTRFTDFMWQTSHSSFGHLWPAVGFWQWGQGSNWNWKIRGQSYSNPGTTSIDHGQCTSYTQRLKNIGWLEYELRLHFTCTEFEPKADKWTAGGGKTARMADSRRQRPRGCGRNM
ncbi:hypothetical protein E3U43_011785 [Larimichthys crocea]|uniref:Uncharacterized protein n=1 Tax=Larimichthys crocea TaxID=215358 RepID=A0ACD3QKM2_LARCR|nr:hypothetical protein E3U43_011785 [Larimichthys crocea]